MKSILKTIFCILLIASSGYAFGQLELGVKLGINFAKVKTTNFPYADNLEYESIAGISFGVTSQIDFNEKLHLNSDFLFTIRGYDIYDYKTTITYIEIPVLLSYSVIEKLEIELGPNVAFRIKPKNTETVNYEFFDFGLSTGLRCPLSEKIILSCRYYHGITSITTLYKTTNTESKTFNRTWQFTVGYRIK